MGSEDPAVANSNSPNAANNPEVAGNEMRFESHRLTTFADWPSDAPVAVEEARKIAKAGFFSTGCSAADGSRKAEVKCPWCDCVLSEWEYGDQVVTKHRSVNPDCPFIRNESDNVPLINMNEANRINNAAGEEGGGQANSEEDRLNQSTPMEDEEVDYTESHQPSHSRVTPDEHSSDAATTSSAMPSARTNSAVPPAWASTAILNHDLRFEAVRLKTFAKWPLTYIQPQRLAKSGFVYMGVRDCVRCVFCGEYVDGWTADDDPIVVHRTLFPLCLFMRGRDDRNVPIDTDGSTEDQRQTPDEAGSDAATSSSASYSIPAFNPENVNYNKELRFEAVRLKTFAKWPLSYIQPQRLAKSGFVYMGFRDCVGCVFCAHCVDRWTPGDDPVIRHRTLFPRCSLMRGRQKCNVPIDANDTEISQGAAAEDQGADGPREDESGITEDECGIRPRRIDLNSGPEKGPGVLHWSSGDVAIGEPSSGVMRHSGPKTAKFSTVESRLRTFEEWPPALRQRPEELAEAGFYYIGFSDQVKCFYCDGGLRNWQPEDDPWKEHSRWFSKCGFVRLVKGDEFITKCLADRPPEELPGFPMFSSASSSKDVVLRDEDIQHLMSSPIAQQVLDMGIEASRVNKAIRERLRTVGSMFKSTHELVDAAFGVHMEQEGRYSTEIGESPSSSAFERSSSCPGSTMEGMDLVGSGETLTGGARAESQELSTSAKSEAPSASGISHSKSAPMDASSEFKSLEETKFHSFTEGTDLEKENRRLKEQRTCKICMDNEIGVVFLPCGHLICCKNCAPALKECPMCRQPIHGTVKTYMS